MRCNAFSSALLLRGSSGIPYSKLNPQGSAWGHHGDWETHMCHKTCPTDGHGVLMSPTDGLLLELAQCRETPMKHPFSLILRNDFCPRKELVQQLVAHCGTACFTWKNGTKVLFSQGGTGGSLFALRIPQQPFSYRGSPATAGSSGLGFCGMDCVEFLEHIYF